MERFEYVRSNTWKEENAVDEKQTKERKGLQVLKDKNLFYKHRINNGSIYWKCVHDCHTKCKTKRCPCV